MSKKRKAWLRAVLAAALLLVVAFGLVGSAYAIEIVEDDTIPAGQVVDDDVFIAGDSVLIDGTVSGNLFAVGSSVTLNGTVNGSIFAAGQTITINGYVGGSVYVAGGSLILGSRSTINRNAIFAGFALKSTSGSTVNRDLLAASYQVVHSGVVYRDVTVAVAALEINGRVGGDVTAEVGTPTDARLPIPPFGLTGAVSPVAPGLRVGDDATISGGLEYTSPVEQSDEIRSEPAGDIVYKETPAERIPGDASHVSAIAKFGYWLLGRLRDFITLLVLGALALWLIPKLLRRTMDKAISEPLPAAGWGFVVTILGYVAAALAAAVLLALVIFLSILTLGGLADAVAGIGFSSFGLALAVFVLLVHFGSKLVVAFVGGEWILQKIWPKQADSKLWPLVLGAFLYVLLRGIPVLGWFLGVAVTITGMGAMWLLLREKPKKPAAKKA